MTFTCGICGFVMNDAGECPRCKLEIAERAAATVDTGEERDVIDQVADWLDAEGGAG
jgi:tRNA(Ile2) C34 agmatinyltransferase TiaS